MNWKQWFKQLLIALDQFFNVLLTPGSDEAWADETLSARSWRLSQEGRPDWVRARKWIDRILFWDTDHCFTSYIQERLRGQSPPGERQ
jgi:hypothetical protein